MMVMRPPQQGQGGSQSSGSGTSTGSGGGATASNSRARAILALRAELASKPTPRARTSPLVLGAQDSSAPGGASNAARLLRATSPVPSALPAGRTDVNEPPIYTTPPVRTIARTYRRSILVARRKGGLQRGQC